MKRFTLQRTSNSSKGQALVEFALVLPILVLILMGVIQLGLMLSAYVGATNVAREVARYGSVCVVKDSTSAGNCTTDIQNYLNATLPSRINAGVVATDKSGISYCYYPTPGDPTKFNVRLTVDVGVRYPLFIPIIGNLMDGIDGEPGDGHFLLLAKEAMRVEGGALPSVSGVTACP